MTRDDVAVDRNPVPPGLAGRRPGATRGAPLLRTPRTLPRVLGPDDVDLVLGELRTHRDRAMVLAMLVGGLRRCEVLALRLPDLSPGERRVFIAEGKGGHQRVVPISARFFAAVGEYLDRERRASGHDRLFVVLRGPTRGQPLTAAGLDEIIDGLRKRAGLQRLTCHQLRHTCLTRLREAGMALEAVQAQAGHRSIESTRIYIHLANAWLAGQYLSASAAIDADLAEPKSPGRRRGILMPRLLAVAQPHLVTSYLAHRAAQGMGTDHKVRWGARALLAKVPDLVSFPALPLEQQLAFNHETHRFIGWLAVTGRLRPGADYLVARRPRLGITLARVDPELHLRFMETARMLGFRDYLAHGQFNLLAHLAALAGKRPQELVQADWDEGRRLLLDAARRIPDRGVKALSTSLFNLEATLFHAGLSDSLPRRRSRAVTMSASASGRRSHQGWPRRCAATWNRSRPRCGRAR